MSCVLQHVVSCTWVHANLQHCDFANATSSKSEGATAGRGAADKQFALLSSERHKQQLAQLKELHPEKVAPKRCTQKAAGSNSQKASGRSNFDLPNAFWQLEASRRTCHRKIRAWPANEARLRMGVDWRLCNGSYGYAMSCMCCASSESSLLPFWGHNAGGNTLAVLTERLSAKALPLTSVRSNVHAHFLHGRIVMASSPARDARRAAASPGVLRARPMRAGFGGVGKAAVVRVFQNVFECPAAR